MTSNDNETEDIPGVKQLNNSFKTPFLFTDDEGNWVYHASAGFRWLYKSTVVNTPKQQRRLQDTLEYFAQVGMGITIISMTVAFSYGYWLALIAIPASIILMEIYIQKMVLKGLPKSNAPFPRERLKKVTKQVQQNVYSDTPERSASDYFVMMVLSGLCIATIAFIALLPRGSEQVVSPTEQTSALLWGMVIGVVSVGTFFIFLNKFLDKIRVNPNDTIEHEE